jgi:hypothetical protein
MLRVVVAALPVLMAGCLDKPPPLTPGLPVFSNGFSKGLTPHSFDPKQGADVYALSVDRTRSHAGTSSIKIEVPPSGFAGGAVTSDVPQDLSANNALTFWAMASAPASFDKLGFGLSFDNGHAYENNLLALPLTTTWTRHLIPIPDPERLTAEYGMLWYNAKDAVGYTAWFDEVRFETVPEAILALQPALAASTSSLLAGNSIQLAGLSLHYADFDGTVRAVDSGDAAGSGPAPAYFTLASSDQTVATVNATGMITGVGAGQASITASLAGQPIPGAVTVNVTMPPPMAPSLPPPAPTLAAADVIALLSKPYPQVPVDDWGADWNNNNTGPNVTSVVIGGDPMKKYTGLIYIGVDFAGAKAIDATAMNFIHIDVWSPDATYFKIKLVDFGSDAAYGGTGAAADTTTELTYTGSTSPAVVTRQWISFDVPLSSFSGLASRAHLAQLILSSSTATVFIDNVYFHK